MFCHRNRQETHRNIPLHNLQHFGCNEGCISPKFPSTIRRRRHWMICRRGKTDFLESVGRTWPRRWQNTGTFTASCGRTTIWSNHLRHILKHFLSVIFASHRIDKSSRCKAVAFQEETSVIRGSLPPSPQKAALLPAIMRAHYQAITQYNIGIYRAPYGGTHNSSYMSLKMIKWRPF